MKSGSQMKFNNKTPACQTQGCEFDPRFKKKRWSLDLINAFSENRTNIKMAKLKNVYSTWTFDNASSKCILKLFMWESFTCFFLLDHHSVFLLLISSTVSLLIYTDLWSFVTKRGQPSWLVCKMKKYTRYFWILSQNWGLYNFLPEHPQVHLPQAFSWGLVFTGLTVSLVCVTPS